MVVHAFLGAVESTRERKPAHPDVRYPYKDKCFYPLLWPAQAMAVYATSIVLPMGRGRPSVVLPRPDGFPDEPVPAKIVWNGIGYELHAVMTVPEQASIGGDGHATVDLGQIHQAAVTTNTGQGLIVSRRGIRSEKRRHNLVMGKIQKKKARSQKGSRRYRRLAKAQRRDAVRSERRVRDLRHKGIRHVLVFCRTYHVRALYVGNPDGVRTVAQGCHQNQRMAQWEYGKDKEYLAHKSQKAGMVCFTGTERGTSSQCSSCGHRQKPKGRVWQCQRCGFVGHRDLVGSVNMHPIVFGESPSSARPRIYDPARRTPGKRWSMKIPPWEVVDARTRATVLQRCSCIGATRRTSSACRASREDGSGVRNPSEAHLL